MRSDRVASCLGGKTEGNGNPAGRSRGSRRVRVPAVASFAAANSGPAWVGGARTAPWGAQQAANRCPAGTRQAPCSGGHIVTHDTLQSRSRNDLDQVVPSPRSVGRSAHLRSVESLRYLVVRHCRGLVDPACGWASSSAQRTAAAADTAGCICGDASATAHVWSPTTCFWERRANAISLKVPKPIPTAMSTSLAHTTMLFRASPRPVGRAIETNWFASPRSVPGRMPTQIPPAACAPLQAAAITPPRPPETTIAPA